MKPQNSKPQNGKPDDDKKEKPEGKKEEGKKLAKVLLQSYEQAYQEMKEGNVKSESYDEYISLLDKYTFQKDAQKRLLVLIEMKKGMKDEHFGFYLEVIDKFYRDCSERIREGFLELIAEALRGAEEYSQRKPKLFPMMEPYIQKYMTKYEPGVVSPFHSIYAHLLFALKRYDEGAFLHTEMFRQVDQHVRPENLQRFLFYVGSIAIFNRDFKKALFLLNEAIRVPMKKASVCSICAYKKASFLNLIVNYKQYTCPRNDVENIFQMHENLQCYLNVQQVFQDPQKVHHIVEAYGKIFDDDGNSGLAKQVYAASIYSRVIKLSQVFSAFELSQLERRVGASKHAIKAAIIKMTELRIINAEIVDDVVHFLPEKVKDTNLDALTRDLQISKDLFEASRLYLTMKEEEISARGVKK